MEELLRIAENLGARRVALCGSVARGSDHDGSDIDFYVKEFAGPDQTARVRANRLVKGYRLILQPYGVDIRGIPGWLLSADHEASMLRDAIELEQLRQLPGWSGP